MENFAWVANKTKDTRRNPFGPPTRDTSIKKRAVLKNGEYNVLPPRFPGRCIRYLHDIFTGLVDAEWIWTLQVLGIGFTGGWLIFSLIWWLIAYCHTDLLEDHLPTRQAETGWTPCVLNIHGFPSCFLYSLETQHTTGYGLRAITEECPEAIFILCCQCIFGLIVDGFTVGVVVAKMIRPRMTNFTIQFSRNAVVALRDGELCLMFRAGDLKKYPLIGASVRAVLIQNKKTKEGDILKSFHSDLSVEVDDAGSDLFFVWPITIVHKINEDSPFYRLSAAEMLRSRFEIVLLLEGTVGSTGQGTNAQTSYLANEILWGHRFKTMVTFNEKLQCYVADYEHFEKTILVQMPFCSAAEMKEGIKSIEANKEEEIKAVDGRSDEKKDPPECFDAPLSTKQKAYDNSATQVSSEELYQQSSPFENRSKILLEELLLHQISNNINIDEEKFPPKSITDYYSCIDRDIKPNNFVQRTRRKKHALNNYDYVHYAYLENIPEIDERSDTPPFPNWV